MSRQELEALFLENLSATERILGALVRRSGFAPDVGEEFAAWAKLRLIENDYAILAKFRGEASITTYLTVVLAMLLREYRVQHWGRWRPSAAAKRNGPLGIRLETLIIRDGVALAAAGQLLRTSGVTTLSDRELGAMVATFPRRAPPRPPVDKEDALASVPGSEQADDTVVASESEAESSATKKALDQALGTLSPDDQVVVRLHFLEAMSVADIARALALPQKPLYRRVERALAALRTCLERAGVSRDRVRELASGPP